MDPFRHGVASFDPLTDAVLLWTRVEPGWARLGWKVARAPADPHATAEELVADVVAEGTATVEAGRDGCVTVDVGGLEPATTYHYWFEADGVLSPVGRTRTLPTDTDMGPPRLRVLRRSLDGGAQRLPGHRRGRGRPRRAPR